MNTAQANFVGSCFAISPGLTMTYSSEPDFATLANKLAGFAKLGVFCFALFLDDVPQKLQDPQDQARFKTLAQAHIHLINMSYEHLKYQAEGSSMVTRSD